MSPNHAAPAFDLPDLELIAKTTIPGVRLCIEAALHAEEQVRALVEVPSAFGRPKLVVLCVIYRFGKAVRVHCHKPPEYRHVPNVTEALDLVRRLAVSHATK